MPKSWCEKSKKWVKKNNIHWKTKRMTRITANCFHHRVALTNNLKCVWFKISGPLTWKSEWVPWILYIQKITCSKKFWWVKNKQTPNKLLLMVSVAKKKYKTNTALFVALFVVCFLLVEDLFYFLGSAWGLFFAE